MGGFLGFDYSCLQIVFVSMGIPQHEWEFLLDKIAVISGIAFKHWNVKDD